MNSFTIIKLAAVMLPALAMSIPMAQAADEECECTCETETTTVMNESNRENAQHGTRQNAEQPAKRTVTIVSSDATTSSQTEMTQSHYLAVLPTGGYHSDSLIGREVTNRNNDKAIGEVSNLVFDADGQILALIVSVGGMLGLGERDVAIAWNEFERGHDGEQATLSINLPGNSLKNAPSYVID